MSKTMVKLKPRIPVITPQTDETFLIGVTSSLIL
jgi:hypothetical protein